MLDWPKGGTITILYRGRDLNISNSSIRGAILLSWPSNTTILSTLILLNDWHYKILLCMLEHAELAVTYLEFQSWNLDIIKSHNSWIIIITSSKYRCLSITDFLVFIQWCSAHSDASVSMPVIISMFMFAWYVPVFTVV